LDGCRKLGFRTQTISRNVAGCSDCGFCGYGCRSGAKQDTRQTFLKDAVSSGARILTECKIDSLITRGNRIVGANARIGMGAQSRKLEISCDAVVLAGGAIQSAALLLRSGLQNENIGRHLFLHPTTAIASFFDRPVEAWKGPPQTIVCDEFENLDGKGYGVRLEVAPMHPGFGAMAMAWASARQHKDWMRQFSNMANIVVLTRDQIGGRVSLGNKQQVQVDYRLSSADARHLLMGVRRALDIHRAAGAIRIVGPHQIPIVFQHGDSFEPFAKRVLKAGTKGNLLSLFSAHQMSTCRIAANPQVGVFDPSGKSFERDNLYVADASCLPTNTGVNPMISIMTVADVLSRNWSLTK